jgi:hypothetical protein
MNTAYRSGVEHAASALPAPAGERARASLAAAQQVARGLGAHGHELALRAQTAFVHGLSQSLLAGAAALVLGAAFVALRAQGRAAAAANAGAESPAATVPTG